MINYKILYDRIQQGERAIDIAFENGISVSTLYAKFKEHNLLKTKKRHPEDVWPIQYEAYKNGKPIIDIADDLNVQSATVYNHFYSLGLKMKERKSIDKNALLKDFESGMKYDELSRKYKCTVTNVRHILRGLKNTMNS